MERYHWFTDRNYILWLAIKDPTLNDIDRKLLKERGLISHNSFGKAILDNSPEWLMKWTSYICQFINFEKKLFPIKFKEIRSDLFEYEYEDGAKTLMERRLGDLITTIDKVKHCLKKMDT